METPNNLNKIPWDDGTGEFLYIDTTAILTQSMFGKIHSDINNTELQRSKTIALTTGIKDNPHSTIYLTFIQDKFSIVTVTYELIASTYEGAKTGYKK